MSFFFLFVCVYSLVVVVCAPRFMMNIRREERDDENTPSRTKDEREKRISALVSCEGGWRLVVVVARLHSLSLSFFLSSKSSSSSLFWKKFPLFLFGEREREREIDACVKRVG